MQNKEMELWEKLKKSNPNNVKDVESMMMAVGYTKGEVAEFLKLKKVSANKSKIDQIKEDIYMRYRLKQRMLNEHIDKNNMLSTFSSMREEDRHVIDSLTRLGDIAPTGPIPGEGALPLRLETFVYKAAHETAPLELAPPLPPATEEEEE